MADKLILDEQALREKFTPEQYHICREHGTERAFTGKYLALKDAGTYRCACCGEALFDADTKFDSGTGWPSFWQPLDQSAVETSHDNSLLMARTEVHCHHCGSHLGHVFEDGPAPTGLRYCVNSAALDFEAKK